MRMHTHRREHVRKPLRQFQHRLAFLQRRRQGDDPADAGLGGPAHHRIEIVVKTTVGQMRVCVHQVHAATIAARRGGDQIIGDEYV